MARPRRDEPGGRRSLRELLEEHGEAVEADLREFYGVRLTDLWRPDGALTWRELGVLVRQLPEQSRTRRAKHGDAALWGDTEHLLATVVDLLAWANWQRVQQVKKTPVPKPQPIRRPGAGTAAAKGAPTADALRDWRRRHGLEEVT